MKLKDFIKLILSSAQYKEITFEVYLKNNGRVSNNQTGSKIKFIIQKTKQEAKIT